MAAWAAALTELGMVCTPADLRHWVGHTDREMAEEYASTLGLTSDHVLEQANRRFRDLLGRERLEPFRDAVSLLASAERMGLAIACATNSHRRRLDWVLSAASLETRFQVTVSSDEVAAPKPHPDVYQEALRQLGAYPDTTVVIEDSPVGIEAGLSAGCTVIAIDRGEFDPVLLSRAHRVVTSLA